MHDEVRVQNICFPFLYKHILLRKMEHHWGAPCSPSLLWWAAVLKHWCKYNVELSIMWKAVVITCYFFAARPSLRVVIRILETFIAFYSNPSSTAYRNYIAKIERVVSEIPDLLGVFWLNIHIPDAVYFWLIVQVILNWKRLGWRTLNVLHSTAKELYFYKSTIILFKYGMVKKSEMFSL